APCPAWTPQEAACGSMFPSSERSSTCQMPIRSGFPSGIRGTPLFGAAAAWPLPDGAGPLCACPRIGSSSNEKTAKAATVTIDTTATGTFIKNTPVANCWVLLLRRCAVQAKDGHSILAGQALGEDVIGTVLRRRTAERDDFAFFDHF